MLKKIYMTFPILKALKEAPSYLKFLRDLLFKKGKLEEALIVPYEMSAAQYFRVKCHSSYGIQAGFLSLVQ